MAISKGALKNLKYLYLGELCVIYLKGMNIVIAHEEAGQMDVTPMLQGIIMDIDEAYIHLGDGDAINKSVKHDDYGVIELVIPQESLMDFDMPINDSEIN